MRINEKKTQFVYNSLKNENLGVCDYYIMINCCRLLAITRTAHSFTQTSTNVQAILVLMAVLAKTKLDSTCVLVLPVLAEITVKQVSKFCTLLGVCSVNQD